MALYDPATANQSIHPGNKVCHAVGWRRWTSSKGSPMIEVFFGVCVDLALPEDADGPGDAGELTKRSFALTPEAMSFWGRFCLALGYATPHDPFDDATVEHIIGLGALIIGFKEREYQGEKQVEANSFKRFAGEFDDAWNDILDDCTAKAQKMIAESNKRQSGGGGGGGGQRRSPTGGGGGAPAGGGGGAHDDIPF